MVLSLQFARGDKAQPKQGEGGEKAIEYTIVLNASMEDSE